MGAVVWFLISRMELWLVAAIAYFCGCFNGAVIISKYILRCSQAWQRQCRINQFLPYLWWTADFCGNLM